jgi:hypothetical protein
VRKRVNQFKHITHILCVRSEERVFWGWVGNATNASFATNAFNAMPTPSLCGVRRISHMINALVAFLACAQRKKRDCCVQHMHNTTNMQKTRSMCANHKCVCALKTLLCPTQRSTSHLTSPSLLARRRRRGKGGRGHRRWRENHNKRR